MQRADVKILKEQLDTKDNDFVNDPARRIKHVREAAAQMKPGGGK